MKLKIGGGLYWRSIWQLAYEKARYMKKDGHRGREMHLSHQAQKICKKNMETIEFLQEMFPWTEYISSLIGFLAL